VTPQQGTVVVKDIQFPGAGSVSGRVLRADGSPAAFASVYARYEYDERYHNETGPGTQTNANGEYQFASLPVGRPIRVQARVSSGFGDLFAEDTTTLATNGANQTLNLAFTAQGARVTASVITADGQPLPGDCQFRLEFDLGEGSVAGTLSGPCGSGVEFTNVPSGTGTLTAFETDSYANYGPLSVTVPEDGQVNAVIHTSIVKGVARFADGTVVPNPSVYLTPEDSGAYLQTSSDDQGNFAAYGVPPGNFTLDIQDGDSGLRASRQGTLVDVNTPVILDVTLPPSGTVLGTFRDRDSQPVPFATVYVRSSGLDLDRYVETDEDGNYRVERVAVGTITVQGQNPDTNIVSVASGVLAVGQELRVDLDTPATGSLSGRVLDLDGTTAVPSASVAASTVTSYGPFGVLRFDTTTNSAGQFQFDALPVGPLQVVAEAHNVLGTRTVQMTAAGATLDVPLGDAIRLPITLSGTDTSRYDIQCDGNLNDGGFGSAGDAYDGAYYLSVAGNQFPCINVGTPTQGGREVVIGPSDITGLRVSRHVYVPTAGGYARYLETLDNPGASDITVSVSVNGNLGSDNATRVIVAPSATDNRYAVTADNGFDPALAHVFAGSGAPVSATAQFVAPSDQVRYSWNVTVPAGGRVSLLHFAVQRATGNTTAAQAQAEALATETQAGMFDGISSADRATIKNFVVAP
jgi:hypothetical protein